MRGVASHVCTTFSTRDITQPLSSNFTTTLLTNGGGWTNDMGFQVLVNSNNGTFVLQKNIGKELKIVV